jgi:hypothetical protein
MVTVKSTIFWDMTLCSPGEVHQHFGGMLNFYHSTQHHITEDSTHQYFKFTHTLKVTYHTEFPHTTDTILL